MKALNPTTIRRTAICVAMAFAVALPGVAAAGYFDKAKNRVQTTKAKVSTTVKKVRKQRPIASALENAGQNLTDLGLIDEVYALNLVEQFRNTAGLLGQIQADYLYFSGGKDCAAECATFRKDLKAVLNDFLELADEVPALDADGSLSETIQRTGDLIDYIPPRALYLMWQAIGSRLDELQSVPDQIRGILSALPPIEDIPDITAGYVDMAGGKIANSWVCEWAGAEDKPYIELIQAQLEQLSWSINTVEGFIPDIEVEAEGGVEGGIAVGMVTGSVAFSALPTDQVKLALKVMAVVPEAVNWKIKMSMLWANAVCDTAERADNIR